MALGFLAAFPDGHITIEDQVAEDDAVATRGTFRGTHLGPFEGLPPTGRHVTMTWIGIDHLAGDRIIERTVEQDAFGLLQQLGAIPAPEHTADDGEGGTPGIALTLDEDASRTSVEHHKTVVQRIVEAANRWEFERLGDLFAERYVEYPAPAGQPSGPAGVRQRWAMLRAAFPDARVTLEEVVAEADRVATRFTLRGTHRGALMGVPPTGKAVAVTGMDINRFVAGRLATRWGEFNTFGLLQQLGALPAQGRAD
jgi:steroid delta-isomerase-like uncharacterized protein